MVKLNSQNLEELKKLWSSRPFSLGIPVIDLQHLWLVFTIIELENVLSDMNKETLESEVALSFTRVIDYVSNHFALEEELLEHFQYNDLEKHIKGHRDFVTRLAEKFHDNKSNEYAALGLLQVLKRWLLSHILHEDVQYSNAFNAQGFDVKSFCNELIKSGKFTVSKEQLAIYQNIYNNEILTHFQVMQPSDHVQEIRKIWKTYNLAVGIPIIDLQHIWLLKMVVELDRSLKEEDSSKDVFLRVVSQAIEYTKDHFSAEEKIMRNFRYPDMVNHISQHKRFIDFVGLRYEENKKGNRLASAHLVNDLKNWLLSHIAFEDKKIGTLYKSRVKEISDFTKRLHKNGEIAISHEQKDLFKAVAHVAPEEIE
jgi:hemerythrin-like metal-binding protein